jgi:hypothetical protein
MSTLTILIVDEDIPVIFLTALTDPFQDRGKLQA